MNFFLKKAFLFIIFCSIVSFDCKGKNTVAESHTFREFSRSITKVMSDNDIPGLSVAVVDRHSILWSDTFGVLSAKHQEKANFNTVFSLQSISKTVTATAVMFAVQEGLVSLDKPIASYLPDFSVGSRFEKKPENRITLRHLLSHRSGLAHEAPVGNNFQTEFDSFEQHIQSISNTWLKAPVGDRAIYSNLGIDLAGYILQIRSGMPFFEYVKSRLFTPLEMENSSFDWRNIEKNKNRAIGHDKNFRSIPLEYALIPSGACYTTASDMTRFLRFHLNRGRYNDNVLLEEKYLKEMYEIPFSNEKYGWALGINVHKRAGGRCYKHAGGGFGFLTTMEWCPDLNIGIVVLTNSMTHDNVHWTIAEKIINKTRHKEINKYDKSKLEIVSNENQFIDLTDEEYSIYSGIYVNPMGNETIKVFKNSTLFGGQDKDSFIPFKFYSKNGDFTINGYGSKYDGDYRVVIDNRHQIPKYILRKGRGVAFYFNEDLKSLPGPNKPEWEKRVGKYSIRMYGKPIATVKITVRNGYLFFKEFLLHEYLPDLFYASNGEVLDFRGEIPTYANIKLYKL